MGTDESVAIPADWRQWAESETLDLYNRHLLRRVHPLQPHDGAVHVTLPHVAYRQWLSDACSAAGEALPAEIDQQLGAPKQLTLFSLNDYLGLSCHPEVQSAAAAAARGRWGMGPRSSALVGGYTQQHAELEAALATLKGCEEALLFPTGYAANMSAMTALSGGGGVHVFSDELNHASIIDGIRLATRVGKGSKLHVYRHNDMQHLDELLSTGAARGGRRLVVTDSLFSMDGDFADLQGLVRLKRRHGFLLVVDEAHASLVYGESGGGAAEAQGVASQVDVHVGTLSKAFGSQGGFIATTRSMRQLLMNRSRPYIYSTALPTPAVAAAAAALRVSASEGWRRRHLRALVERTAEALSVPAQSAILPLQYGAAGVALRAAAQLLQAGFHVPAIRPPTVPPGSSRLRITLSAVHSVADVDRLVAALQGSAGGCPAAGLRPWHSRL